MTPTDWGQALAHWLDRLPALHSREIELGLGRISAVWRRMGSSRPGRHLVTVGGTNGKGSCVAMLEAILRAAGHTTGCYTSPHLYRYNERIRLNGAEADDELICRAFEQVDRARGEIPLTYFEFGTLAAFQILAETGPEVAILEVGLGGRLDAVNILDADVALLTNVAVEHTEWLGADRESIGREKAGIFRARTGAVVGEAQPPRSVVEGAEALGADLALAARDFSYREQGSIWEWTGRARSYPRLPRPALVGVRQLENAAAVLMVLELLGERVAVAADAVAGGLSCVRLAGRFEVRAGEVPVILDVAHNPAAAALLADNLAHSPCVGRTLAVFGVLADKDLPGIVEPLRARVDAWYLAPPEAPRALPLDRLEAVMRGLGAAPLYAFGRLDQAMAEACAHARDGDRILVFGSFITVAEVGGLL